MPLSTNAEAVRDMQRLDPTTNGRLVGLPARHVRPHTIAADLGDTPQPWRALLIDNLTGRRNGSLTADSAEYLVLSTTTC